MDMNRVTFIQVEIEDESDVFKDLSHFRLAMYSTAKLRIYYLNAQHLP